MDDASAHVSEARLREDIESTAEFGAVPGEGRGRTVLPATEPNRKAREYLVRRLEDAGLDVQVDAVGNISGRWVPDGVDPNKPAVASGSHLDSVVEGGIFDGVLGVYAALESVRAIQVTNVDLERPIKVVCFTEEEGTRFSDGVLGSSVAVNECSVEAALGLTDNEGISLESALEEISFRGEGRLDATTWDAWLELHIEQGERLEDAGVPVGIVTAITGTSRCHVSIRGDADHAGTTAMDDRTDALAATSELILEVEAAATDAVADGSETAVSTVGQIDIAPNVVNVIPGRVDLQMDVRDIKSEPIEQIIDATRETLDRLETERGVETTIERPYHIDPTPMSERCIATLRNVADAAGIDQLEFHSGAGHDTMHLAAVTDAGMLFAPSRDGISHSPLEWTDWTDCAAATRVLAKGLADLASE